MKGAVKGRSPSLRHVGDEHSVRRVVHYKHADILTKALPGPWLLKNRGDLRIEVLWTEKDG